MTVKDMIGDWEKAKKQIYFKVQIAEEHYVVIKLLSSSKWIPWEEGGTIIGCEGRVKAKWTSEITNPWFPNLSRRVTPLTKDQYELLITLLRDKE